MSSFTFSNADAGPPTASNGTTTAVNCSNGWACEHRWRTTANLVALHNAAYGTSLSNWWSNGGSQIAFGRGANAYVVFNRDGGSLSRTFQTSLPAGTYCDVANGDVTNGSCSGTAYVVNGSGQFSATVPANGMLALHINARVASSGTCSVTFAATVTTVWGENVYVLGNRAELSNWSTGGGLALSSATYPVWRGAVTLPAGTSIEYKYVKKNGSTVVWESGANRTATCPATVNDTWRN
jgi:alpha-amylase